MGTIQHDALIVTCFDLEMLKTARAKAYNMFRKDEDGKHVTTVVTTIVGTGMNGYYSFMIAPDGSKYGWGMSQYFRDKRSKFLEYLAEFNYPDGSSPFDFVRIEYGDYKANITDTNCT